MFFIGFVCFQIARLRSELDIVRGNIKVMSEMLTEMVPGQENASDLELLQVRLFFFANICMICVIYDFYCFFFCLFVFF